MSYLSRHPKNWRPECSREVVACVADLSEAVSRRGFAGLLLILNELGKLFEYAAHAPQKGDVFILQELAEQASRSGDSPILVLGVLHQSFEEYDLALAESSH